MKDLELEFIGDEPPLAGRICQGLVVLESWEDGRLVEPLHTLFICINSQWHKLYFQWHIIHWRISDAPDLPLTQPPEEGFLLKPVDLAAQFDLLGVTLVKVRYDPVQYGAETSIEFANSKELVMNSANDLSTYRLVEHSS
ncbi:hypothetical protein QWZ03_11395 [Chitinimonas viridis]|uniref:Uncharacterized protein n=1 Tax=Chitinimonas viridis TaxID=664880 RepID=A0ABT8B6J7_9NEIS|nr:hypothetical protein [Chitinimonas viridis]MDN3577370.1 hypothetical protein [Chitinimonas viridis]